MTGEPIKIGECATIMPPSEHAGVWGYVKSIDEDGIHMRVPLITWKEIVVSADDMCEADPTEEMEAELEVVVKG